MAFGYGRETHAQRPRRRPSRGCTTPSPTTYGEGLSGTVYTQLCDVEDEVNGLLTYDREVLKLDEAVVRAALARLRL